MTLCTMTPEHLDGVKDLLDLCFGKSTWTSETIRSQMEKADSRCTVALDNDRIVGFLAFEQIADEGSIIEVAVHPDCRRRGIARRMIDAALHDADDLSVVFLEVRESNLPALRLYESLGFEWIGIRKKYYDDPKENAVIMRKNYENTGN